jgi:glutamate racemase
LTAASRPIGVFDSGVGGLTVVAALRRALPAEAIVYLGDTARLPYGTKSPATVVRYTERNVELLLSRGVKAVVIACNTASALALDALVGHIDVPVWGVIGPGAELAAARSAGRVGVIATEATVLSDAYPRALRALRPELVIHSQPCPLFVPLVEEGWQDDPVAALVAERYLAPLLAARVDTLILGCTHYPLLRATLAAVVGSDVALVDSAEAVAARVAADLAAYDLAIGLDRAPEHHVCVTDSSARFGRLARQILGAETTLELVDLGGGA